MEIKSQNVINFLKLVSPEKTDTLKRVSSRVVNREGLRVSSTIALSILMKIDQLGWSTERFSEEVGISLSRLKVLLTGKETFLDHEMLSLEKIKNLS